MTGQQLYVIWCEARDERGGASTSWNDLPRIDRLAWDKLAHVLDQTT